MDKMSVFLGGTCGSSTWRKKLMPNLQENVDAFNPVVENWNEEAQKREDFHKENDNVNLFVITPETNSPYSLFEIGVCATGDKKRTVVCFLDNENGTQFEGQQAKAVKKIKADLEKAGVPCFDKLDKLTEYLNQRANEQTGYKPAQPGEE